MRHLSFIVLGLSMFLYEPAPAYSGEPSSQSVQQRDQEVRVPESRIVQQPSEFQAVQTALENQRAEFEKFNKARDSWWNGYAVPLLPVLAAIFTAIGGWLVTYLLLKKNFENQDTVRADDRKVKEDERKELYLVEALRYFEGRTQKRSIGIAFIEAYWDEVTRLQKTWTAVLANQAIYILSKLSTDHKLEVHELDNLNRIFELLDRAELQDPQRRRIGDVMKRLSEEESLEVKKWKVKYAAG